MMNVKLAVPKDVTRETIAFSKRILGPLAELSDLFSDKIRFLRYKSAVRTLNRAAEIVREKGIKARRVPIKFLVPFIEECSLEDENSPLIEQWAALLASAAAHFDPLHVVIKEVLRNISSKEAKLLNTLGLILDKNLFKDDATSYEIAEFFDADIKSKLSELESDLKLNFSEKNIDKIFEVLSNEPIVILFLGNYPLDDRMNKTYILGQGESQCPAAPATFSPSQSASFLSGFRPRIAASIT